MSDDVKIPSRAVSDEEDIVEPTRELLQGLRLLGDSDGDGDGAGAVFSGPPQSVAVIEAGATAAAMLDAAETVYKATPAPPRSELVALPTALAVENHVSHIGPDARDWHAVAFERDGEGELRYVVIKGSTMERRKASEIQVIANNGSLPSG